MIIMNDKKSRIRTVNVNERGQIVIPEDIRRDLGIIDSTTLVMIEKDGEILIRKENDVLLALDDDLFWRSVAKESLKRAWGKEDNTWDKISKKDGLK